MLMPADWRVLGAIFAGGAVGSAVRTGLVELVPADPVRGHWPWITFAVNLAGCFLLGYFTTRLQARRPIASYRRPLLCTGFCGALTTFSSFQLELLDMLDHGEDLLALGYCAGSVSAGFLGLALGTAIVRRGRLSW